MLIIASAYSPEPTPITKQMAAHAGPERTCVRPLSRYAACGSAYVTGMIQLPAVYAVHFVRDRWLAIAPDQHAMHGQTFVRQELREPRKLRSCVGGKADPADALPAFEHAIVVNAD